MSLNSVLTLLTELTPKERSVVIATATALGAAPNKQSRKPRGLTSKDPVSGSKKKKGPAQPVSKYAGEPAYIAFKNSEKALKVYLAANKTSLKEALNSDLESETIQNFLRARSAWFFRKNFLTSASDHLSDDQKEKKAEIFAEEEFSSEASACSGDCEPEQGGLSTRPN
jgi:hypothetical protein